jgi:predicted amidohydrolase
MQAMAYQQHVYALVANRAGVERLDTSGREIEYLGSSCIVGPDGKLLALAPNGEPATITATLDAAVLMDQRVELPFAQHRQSGAYNLDPW